MNAQYKYGAIIIEGHVQGLSNTRSLGEIGVPVYVVDTSDCIARYSKYCRKFFKCPAFIEDGFSNFLIDLAKKEKINGWLLVPSNDHAVKTISRNKIKLEKFFKVFVPDAEIFENTYDKFKLLKLAVQVGVPIPKTYPMNSVSGKTPDNLEFPVIIKGRHGLSFKKALGAKVFLANNKNTLKNHIQMVTRKIEPNDLIIQELIPHDRDSKTISFTAFCEKGCIKTFWMGEKLREHPIRFGTATFATSLYNEKCHLLSIPLLHTLNFSGICEIEYLKDPRDGLYKLIEINARTWLWVGLAKACGVDFIRLAYEVANGSNPEYPKDYALGKSWINPFTDVIFSVISILKGQLSVKSYLSSVFCGDLVNALFNKGDLVPGLIYFFNLFMFWRDR